MRRNAIRVVCVGGLLWSAVATAAAQPRDVQDLVEKPVEKAIDLRQQTQKDLVQWQEEKQRLTAQYEQLQQDQQALEAEKEALLAQVAASRDRIAIKSRQLADTRQIADQIGPFLNKVVARLKTFIQNDLPFLEDERRQRLQNLESILADPQLPVSEKFRKVMEALMVEAEYGQTIEVVQQTVVIEDRPTLVNQFRMGRVALFYQTLDKQQCGFFNVADNRWQPLPEKYHRAVHAALEIGAKRQPVEMLTLPIGRIVVQ